MSERALAAIQEWELDEEAFARSDAERVEIGPFRVSFEWGYAFPFRAARSGELVPAIDEVCETARRRGRRARWEFNERAWPGLADEFADAGLALESRNPLMACGVADFRPFGAPGVALELLNPETADADLCAFQSIRWRDDVSRDRFAHLQALDRLRTSLARPTARYVLARIAGEPAGTGVSHRGGTVAEIVGIVTLPRFRRRGVASTVTNDLVRRHFADGGTLAFLDASGSEAESLYARLGFRGIGDRLTFVDPE